jgi:hypothetical protein
LLRCFLRISRFKSAGRIIATDHKTKKPRAIAALVPSAKSACAYSDDQSRPNFFTASSMDFSFSM